MATLFVGNISAEVDTKYLFRLFAAYGSVKDCTIDPSKTFAIVVYHHVDDADSAIAALHLRYCMAPRVSLIVLYHKDSAIISEYGRRVWDSYSQYLARFERGGGAGPEFPTPVLLKEFDPKHERNTPRVPQLELPAPFHPGMLPGTL